MLCDFGKQEHEESVSAGSSSVMRWCTIACMNQEETKEKLLAPVLGLIAILASVLVFVLGLYILTIVIRLCFSLG